MQKTALAYQAKWFSGDTQLNDAYFIRDIVFVQEQNVPLADEYDGTDKQGCHVVLYIDDQPVATGRFLSQNGSAHLGRIAVLPQWRGKNLGMEVVNLLIEKAQQSGLQKQDLNAQCHARAFYERLGFVAQGDVFQEAGIAHITMVRNG